VSPSSRARSTRARPKLRELAGRLGILPEYHDMQGRLQRTGDETRATLLTIMGFDAPDEDAARGWLAELDHEERQTILEPVRVVRRDDPSAHRIRVRVPDGARRASVEVTVTEEAGHAWRATGSGTRTVSLTLPSRLPLGYHRADVVVSGAGGGREWSASQSLIVVPDTCTTPAARLGDRGAMGVVANLYAVRRERDWGVGDFTTLTQLAEWAGTRGADFVGVNPLHALFNRRGAVSPYGPVSRLFRNHIYIDVESVPGFEHPDVAREAAALGALLGRVRTRTHVAYDAVIDAKERVLLQLYRIFRQGSGAMAQHARAHDEFVREREPELTRYATWMAIAERAGETDWRRWPAAMRDPGSPAVLAFQRAHEERVGFHRWLQFETHRQLGESASRARVLGMRLGIYQDLAIGTNPGGSDTWSFPDLFLAGATVGAPPDPYSATGQNWGLPPTDPRALRRQGYRYWIQLLRRAFEHAGALRLDHIMGLFRLYWIPEGATGRDGAYVRYPSEDLLGILALESARHDALVVGENLGIVPREVAPALRRWGILSSKVLLFERDRRGFRPASRYPRMSLATANTHDMPTLAGYWTGDDIELRAKFGLAGTHAEVRAARRERERERQALLRVLRLRAPRASEAERFPRALTAAVHEFLCATPAVLAGLSLDDLMGETTPVNVPGVGQDEYPCWRRRSRMTVEELAWSFEADDAMRCGSRRRA